MVQMVGEEKKVNLKTQILLARFRNHILPLDLEELLSTSEIQIFSPGC